jgi:hypothetical protein
MLNETGGLLGTTNELADVTSLAFGCVAGLWLCLEDHCVASRVTRYHREEV